MPRWARHSLLTLLKPLPAPASPLLAGLSSYWGMHEASGTRFDATHDGLDLTAVNNPASMAGKIGQACALVKASNQYLTHVNDPLLQLAGISHTVAGWWYFTSLSGVSVLFSKDNNGAQANDRSVSLAFYAGALHYNMFDASNNVVMDAQAPGAQLPTGTWLFIAARYNAATGKANIRVNATQNADATQSGTPTPTTSPLRIGADNNGSTHNLDGAVNALGLWQANLSNAYLDTLWNGGNGLEYPF